jgi:signal transduction histidine kinase
LAILVGTTLSILRDSNEHEIERRAQLGAKLIASAAKDAIIAEDVATLHSLTEEALSSGQIAYLRILDRQGHVLAEQGSADLLARVFTIDSDIRNVDDGIYDWSSAVTVGGIRYGEVRLGISVAPLQALLISSQRWAGGVALVELLLVGLFSWLLGSYLTRQLRAFRAASDMFAAGQLAHRIPVTGNDELAETAISLNEMARRLSENLALLAQEEQLRIAAQADLEFALAAVEDRNEQLNSIFELSPHGFVSFDQQSRVKYLNTAFIRMTGLDLKRLIGMSESEFITTLAKLCVDKNGQSSLDELRELLQKSDINRAAASSSQPEDKAILKIGAPYAHSLEVRARRAHAKTVSRIFYCRDVSYEYEVDRMKTEFLSTAAHELRTPMSSIYGFSELLLNCQFSEPERREYLQIIHKQSQLIDAIISDLLDLARIDARQGKDIVLQPLQLGAFIEHTLSSLNIPQGRIQPKWQMTQDYAVLADSRRLTQALFNVLSNAYKYSPHGGDIHISLHKQRRGDSDYVGIRVQDSGIGMTPEQVLRVFERFYRADSSGNIPGTGLGMSITKEIIELHHGSIEVYSKPGEGCTVTIWLPQRSKLA